ncbi:MAG: DMT family transporter [Clostridiales bacterium]|nr:DMT family transporter [Clostridiales bacterium]
MVKGRKIGNLLLLLTALIWGFAFVAQSEGMAYVGPFTFQSIRCFFGVLTLLPLIIWKDSRKKKEEDSVAEEVKKEERKRLLRVGLICGLFLFIASNLQQIGIKYTTVGKAGFLTSMYLILVPILGAVLFRNRISGKIGFCVVLSVIGIYLLSMTETLTLSKGDTLVLLCAVFFAFHILTVDRLAGGLDGVKISCIQLLVTSVLSGIPMILWEHPDISSVLAAGIPLLYAGVLSCGVAYTLQIVGQQYAEPTTATILMSMESVFSLLGGVLILRQIPGGREITGCILVFIAVVLAQIPLFEKKTEAAKEAEEKLS